MKNLDNDEAADVLATVAVYKAYKTPLIEILVSHVSISSCLLSHQLSGQEEVLVL